MAATPSSVVLLFLLVCVGCWASSNATTTQFYVATNGKDSNPGTSPSEPLATVAGAQVKIRALKASHNGMLPGPVQVNIAPGTYQVVHSSPITFTPQDSGSPSTPITFVSQDAGQPAMLSGGITVTNWQPTTINLRSGGTLDVWQAHLPSASGFRQLWVNGERRTLARSPLLLYASATEYEIVAKTGQIPDGLPATLAQTELVLYEAWTAPVHKLKSVTMANNTLQLTQPFATTWVDQASGHRYYFQNVLAELDTAGEFFFNESSHVLTYAPMSGEEPSQVQVVVPQSMQLMVAAGNVTSSTAEYVTNIHWVNVSFAHSMVETASCFESSCSGQSASFLTTAALNLNGIKDWVFDGVTVAHTGGYGIWINKAAFNTVVQYSHVYDVGAGAVRVGPPQSGVEAVQGLRNVGSVVTDSVLEDGGYYYKMGCGVLAQQVANASIVHNDIRSFLYTGVSLGWTWGYAPTSVGNNTIGFNFIHDIAQGQLCDLGCVYTLGTQRGTQVINNICHNVTNFAGGYGGWGLYTDEGSSFELFENNIVYHTACAGIHQHYGLNNSFTNNVLAMVNTGTCDGALRSSQHPGKCVLPAKGENQGRCSSFQFEQNIISQPSGTMLYSTIPTGFQNMTFFNNTYWRASDPQGIVFPEKTTFKQWQAEGKDSTSVIANPQFVDPQDFEFGTVKSTSPALPEGFKDIDTSTIGPRARV